MSPFLMWHTQMGFLACQAAMFGEKPGVHVLPFSFAIDYYADCHLCQNSQHWAEFKGETCACMCEARLCN